MRTWIEINAQALLENLKSIQASLGNKTAIAPVVKANAYGHGIVEILQLLNQSYHTICVDSLQEAQIVANKVPGAQILIMGYVPIEDLKECEWNDRFQLAIYDFEFMQQLQQLSVQKQIKIKVHLKIETGLNRLGLNQEKQSEVLAWLKQVPNLDLKGVYTHFANVEDTLDPRFYLAQHQAFVKSLELIQTYGFHDLQRHSCASAAALLHAEAALDLARVGIAMYGYYSSWQTLLSLREKSDPFPKLTPVMCVKTRVAQIKDLVGGSFVGYGCTHQVLRDSKIAVLPVGYYDGYPRSLSSKAKVLICGKRAPVIGRVAMNMCMVDVSHIKEINIGDEVVLLGNQGEQSLYADELAGWGNTIHYEILSNFNANLPRLVVNTGEFSK